AVIGPDHPAAPVVIVGIVVAAAVKVTVMMEAVTAMPASTVPASMPAATVEVTAAMPTAEASTMETAAVKSVPPTVTSSPMTSTKARIRHESTGCGFRRGREARTHR